jgi:hypothetical protein
MPERVVSMAAPTLTCVQARTWFAFWPACAAVSEADCLACAAVSEAACLVCSVLIPEPPLSDQHKKVTPRQVSAPMVSFVA